MLNGNPHFWNENYNIDTVPRVTQSQMQLVEQDKNIFLFYKFKKINISVKKMKMKIG